MNKKGFSIKLPGEVQVLLLADHCPVLCSWLKIKSGEGGEG